MRLIFRWLFRLLLLMMGLGALVVLGAYYLLSRSLPDYDTELRVAGPSARIEIVRDTADIPHIFGETDADSFFGLGYVHAQDRLWQMMLLRRTVQGRLSELFGMRTLGTDKIMRRFGLYEAAVASFDAQDAATRAALTAYAAGVNARLTEINDRALGRGAPEMFWFNAPVAPWQPGDSLAIIKLMAVQLSTQLGDEVLNARLSLALDDEIRVRDLMPDVPGPGLIDLPRYASVFPGAGTTRLAAAGRTGEVPDPLSPFAPVPFGGASNVWAAGPSRSASGGTLLANDPHLGFTAPSIWYLARLELTGGGVIGGTIPGIPAVLVGRSDRLGWGITASYLDDQDLFIEELNPGNPQEYRTPEGFRPFRTASSIIRIKDAPPVTMTLRWTENGLVLPGTHYRLDEITPPGHVVSLAWTALSREDTTMTAALHLMQAQDVDAALEAGRLQVAPSQNLVVVDRDRIGYQLVGAMPKRDPGHETRGRRPSRGWIARNRWQGMFPYADNPRRVQPAGGILGNTNNKSVNRPFPGHVSYYWGDTQRVHRWKKLMQSRQVHTRESFIEAQLDIVSFTARTLLPLVGKDLWYTGEAAPADSEEALRHQALRMLAEWNGEMNEHMPEPLIYVAWMQALMDRLARDELGPLADSFAHPEPLFIERVFRDIDGAAVWCDVIQSAGQETCSQMARMALDDALQGLVARYGRRLESYRWGDAHQATHDHPVLGRVPILRHLVNIRQPTSGGDNTLQRGLTRGGKGPGRFENIHGAGYRGVYDMEDPDSSVFITSTGQSGHFLSRHYDDLAQLWRRGEFVPMSLDPALARAAATGITVLIPGAE